MTAEYPGWGEERVAPTLPDGRWDATFRHRSGDDWSELETWPDGAGGSIGAGATGGAGDGRYWTDRRLPDDGGDDGWDGSRGGEERFGGRGGGWDGPPPRRGLPGTGVRPRRSRLRRYTVRLLFTAIGLVLVFALAFGSLLLITPSTADARKRVAASEATHGGVPLTGALPAKVVSALVATEDSRFYSHHGIDPLGAVRGITEPLLGGDQGGATLDQQLVKLLYTGGRRRTSDQIKQTALAVKLDHRYSKNDILRMYLDTVYFGHGFYGINRAAAGYFGVTPAGLSWTQAAMLAGLVQAPTAFDPFVHLDAARARESHVIDRLVSTGRLTKAQATAVRAQPLNLR
jgi:penicillin-binding protein 1A